jgi:hypothetical protein
MFTSVEAVAIGDPGCGVGVGSEGTSGGVEVGSAVGSMDTVGVITGASGVLNKLKNACAETPLSDACAITIASPGSSQLGSNGTENWIVNWPAASAVEPATA